MGFFYLGLPILDLLMHLLRVYTLGATLWGPESLATDFGCGRGHALTEGLLFSGLHFWALLSGVLGSRATDFESGHFLTGLHPWGLCSRGYILGF